MGRFRIHTSRGYNLFDVVSALQKSIRRNRADLAVYFILEMYASGYWHYCWRRLLTISAEDVAGCITQEVKALFDSFLAIHKGNKKMDRPEGRLFLAKAAILLANAYKSRDADHAIIYLYDREKLTADVVREFIEKEVKPDEEREIPEFAYDCHTAKGKAAGKTKADFLKSEQKALKPKMKGLFDDLVDED